MKEITVFSKHNETKKRKKDFIQAVSSTHRTEKKPKISVKRLQLSVNALPAGQQQSVTFAIKFTLTNRENETERL